MGMLRETRLCLGLNTCWRWIKTKTDKNTASVFRVFDLLYIHRKPYESELSTALYECKAVARCATRKTDTAINRIKTVGACKLRIENTYGRKQNKALSDILSPHIPYKNLEYEQKEKIQHDFLPV